ncbi:MAG: tRNA-intron lyase [Candidatus Methanoplasma sp.]|jgi:tRNA-intron endonuclease|nr:tRNA-intron lyase [Candidatus Methanoplasma sp.]
MPGELRDDSVFVADVKEGSRHYNKGNFGYPMHGGGLELDLIEAVFLLECDRLEVLCDGRQMTFEELFIHASAVHDGFDIVYIVYRDLRQRGFVVKAESGGFDLSVFPRGSTMSDSRPTYMVRAVSERTEACMTDLSGEVAQTENAGRRLLYGVVDEEGDLTYYIMSARDPGGSVKANGVARAVRGHLIRDRVFVFDGEGAKALREGGFYGKIDGSGLQLSLIEGCHLISTGELEVESSSGSMSESELREFGRRSQNEFDLRMKAFVDLRRRGLVVKTGFKYGTHFRVYEGSPDDCHARYLVHAIKASQVTMWPEISRTVRLSGGVKKEILFCRVGSSVEYLEFKWFRP